MFPETEESETKGVLKINYQDGSENMFDSMTNGARAGGKLAINIAVVVIGFICIIALFNSIIQGFFGLFGLNYVSLDFILSYLFSPISLMMGVTDFKECLLVGQLLGKKMMINEFIAYFELANMIKLQQLSKRAEVLATYA